MLYLKYSAPQQVNQLIDLLDTFGTIARPTCQNFLYSSNKALKVSLIVWSKQLYYPSKLIITYKATKCAKFQITLFLPVRINIGTEGGLLPDVLPLTAEIVNV